MEKTELISFRERYEKETGMVSHQYGGVPREEYVTWLERENAKLEAKLTEVLEIQTVEKFQEIIRNQCDEILALKDQLRWRPVSEKPKENISVEVCDLSKSSLDEREPEIGYYENGEWFCIFPYDLNIYKKITPTHWRYIPPAPEGE